MTPEIDRADLSEVWRILSAAKARIPQKERPAGSGRARSSSLEADSNDFYRNRTSAE
jgi:hypothetical protein